MDAVEFLKAKERMCASAGDCINCALMMPTDSHFKGVKNWCDRYMREHPEEVVMLVERWNNNHQGKTRLDALKEFHPSHHFSNVEHGIVCPKVTMTDEEAAACSLCGKYNPRCFICSHHWWREPFNPNTDFHKFGK